MSSEDSFISTLEEKKKTMTADEFTKYLWEHEDQLDIRTVGFNFSPEDYDRWCYRHFWLPKIQQYESIPTKPELKVIYYYTKSKLLDSLRTLVFIKNTDADRLVWRTDHWDILRGSPFTLKCMVNDFNDSIPLNEFLNLISTQTTPLQLKNGQKINIYRTISLVATIPPEKLYTQRSAFDKIFTPVTTWTTKMSIFEFTQNGLRYG